MKKALITGITGQDGSYLAEFLLKKGYEVHGLVRGSGFSKDNPRLHKIAHILDEITIHHGDVTDYPSLWRVVSRVKPDETYHLAGILKFKVVFEDEFNVFKTNTTSTHYLLSALKELNPDCKFFYAGTSEVFGSPKTSPQNEETPMKSVTPYGISKITSTHFVKMYREVHNLFACTGILFSHISPRTDTELLPRKVTSTAAKLKKGVETKLELGDLKTRRDWGFAGDYVEGMWQMLQQEEPDDYVIGTGTSHSVEEVIKIVFECLDLNWKKYVQVDKKFFRPADAPEWLADISKIKKNIGWSPKTPLKDVLVEMTKSDLEALNK